MNSQRRAAPAGVGVVACAALVTANMVGTGVFTSLGFQVGPLPSAFVIGLLWFVGGIVAICGALSYCELAAAIPHSGGEYTFLSRIYHPFFGFAAGFVSVTIGFVAPLALVALALDQYVSSAWGQLPPKTLAFVAILFLAGVHSVAIHASGTFQVVVTVFKVSLLLGFLALGFLRGNLSGVNFLPSPSDVPLVFSPGFAVCLMFVLYSYTGWNAVTYILGEVRNVSKTAPKAILAATAFVTALYVGLNALFLLSSPMKTFEGKIEIGVISAGALFGATGAKVMAALIGTGLLASLSAMTWAGPRVSQAIGRDFAALRMLARTSSRGIPLPALVLQTGLVLLLIAFASFREVLLFAQSALLACSFFAVLGVIVLRFREPGLPRPFRCPLFPLPPLVFLAITAFAMIHTFLASPLQAFAGWGILALGWAIAPLLPKPPSPLSQDP